MSLADSMRQDWDERARKDAFHYIASWRDDWDAESFFASGEQDYCRLVEPVLSQMGFEPTGKAMLEVGCGAGRMTQSFARRFGSVCAFDVSPEMQKQAQLHLRNLSNVRWVLGDGATLSPLDSESLDFVFSYLVLQHLPTERLVRHFVGEMLRVLRPGGAFLFQFNSATRPTMNWKGRLTWGIVDALWTLGMRRASHSAAAMFHLDWEMAGRSWRGASVEPSKVVEAIGAAGGSLAQLQGEETPMTWCWGTRTGASR